MQPVMLNSILCHGESDQCNVLRVARVPLQGQHRNFRAAVVGAALFHKLPDKFLPVWHIRQQHGKARPPDS